MNRATEPPRNVLRVPDAPAPRPTRQMVTFRCSPAAIDRLNLIAAAEQEERSVVLRRLLKLGLEAWDRGQR